MGDGCKVQPDSLDAAEACEFSLGEVCAIKGDDAVGVTVPVDDVLEEGDGGFTVQLLDWLHLDPLGELVHHDQKMGHASSSRLESSHHVQAPDGEGPGDGDGSEAEAGRWLCLAKC